MADKPYWHRVSDETGTLYDGRDSADAMAVWSKSISLGNTYVMLESLRSPDEQLREIDGAGNGRPGETTEGCDNLVGRRE
jgi:hypothetical protein